MMVLLLFLFLPEAWGTLSHLSQPQSGHLGGYRIPIPTSWIILGYYDQAENDVSGVTGLAGRGLGMGGASYLHGLPFSAWDVKVERHTQSDETQPPRWTPRKDELIDRRDLTIGGASVTCFDYWPSYLDRAAHLQPTSEAYVHCFGTGGFSATLIGRKDKIPAFYRMLEGITQAN